MTPTIAFAWLPEADRSLPLPAYQTTGAAGADVCANFPPEGREGITAFLEKRKPAWAE